MSCVMRFMVKAANCPETEVGSVLFRVRVSKAKVSQVVNQPWRLVRGSWQWPGSFVLKPELNAK